MAKEKITPDRKPVSSQGGVKEPAHSTITTPKPLLDGKVPWGGQSKEKIM